MNKKGVLVLRNKRTGKKIALVKRVPVKKQRFPKYA